MEMKFVLIISAVSFTFFQGCMNKQPMRNDIIGTWNSSDGAYLTFKEDGTFIGKSLPSVYFTFNTYRENMKGKKIDGIGNWKIKNSEGFKEIELQFQQINNNKVVGIYPIFISG